LLTDSHVHLNRSEFGGEGKAVLQRAIDAEVTRFLNVGYDLHSSEQSVVLADADPRILATVGVHPHDAAQLAGPEGDITPEGEQLLDKLQALARLSKVVAIGEIGLDFYRDLSPRPAQRAALTVQLALARQLDLPVVFHIRNAYRETLTHVEAEGLPPAGGVLHAFQGKREDLDWAVAHDFYIGIGGPVTYKNSHLPDLLQYCPLENLLLETDAPWLPPEPYRGKRNEPSYLRLTAQKVAELFGCSLKDLAQQTSTNFEDLFRIGRSGPGA
jgi:TatD DNase family protein